MFTIKKIYLHGTWSLNTYNEECSICRNHIINIDETNNGIVVGKCGHAFHETCINSWIKEKKVCPLCNKKWEYRKK